MSSKNECKKSICVEQRKKIQTLESENASLEDEVKLLKEAIETDAASRATAAAIVPAPEEVVDQKAPKDEHKLEAAKTTFLNVSK